MASTRADTTMAAADDGFWTNLVAKAVAAYTHEELVFRISPMSLVLALSPFFLRHYAQAPVYLRHSPFPIFKMVSQASHPPAVLLPIKAFSDPLYPRSS